MSVTTPDAKSVNPRLKLMPDSFLGLISISIGAIFCISTAIGIIGNYSPVPYWDQWYGTVGWYMRVKTDGINAFLSQHNEHRILLSRLIFWIDMKYFGGVNIFDLFSNFVLGGAMAISLYYATISNFIASKKTKTIIFGLTFIICYSWLQKSNFTWGFQNQWFAVNITALLSFKFINISAERRYSLKWLFMSIFFGILSAFSMANGLLVLPVCIFAALTIGFPARKVIFIVLSTIGTWAAYFLQPGSSVGSLPNGTLSYALTHQPLELIEWTILYLGSPFWFAFHSQLMAGIGGFLTCLGTANGCRLLFKRRELRGLPILAMAIFLIGTALVTAGGRLPFGLANVFQDRYATNGLLAIYCVSAYNIINCNNPITRSWMMGVCTVPLLGVAIFQEKVLEIDHDFIFRQKLAGLALRLGATDDDSIKVLSDNADYIRSIAGEAKTQGLSIFKNDALGYGDIPKHIDATRSCRGSLDELNDTKTPGVQAASGWVYDPTSGTIPRFIVMADADGDVIGEGLSGLPRQDVAQYLDSNKTMFGWAGYVKGTVRPANLYAKIGDQYCKVE